MSRPSGNSSVTRVSRPQASQSFIDAFPREASLYTRVIKAGKPNYLGAKLPVTHQINIPAWRKYAHLLPDTQLVDFLEFGFPVGYTGAEPPLANLPNHSSADMHAAHVHKYITTEVDKLAMLGPITSQPFDQWWRVNPMMTRPKRDFLTCK